MKTCLDQLGFLPGALGAEAWGSHQNLLSSFLSAKAGTSPVLRGSQHSPPALTSPACVPSLQNVLAKALYDNVAESPDELSFRKGDIMTVLERDTQGLDGWWLCSLHGRQGIVPGNRLKILVGMHDKKPVGPGPGPPASSAPPQPSLHAPAAQYTPMLPAAYQPQPDSVYLVPTPSKTQQGLYQAPGPSSQFQSPPAKQTSTFSKQMPHHPFPSPAPDLYQVPPGPGNPAQDIYQVPPSAGMGHDIYQVPPSMDARSWEGTKAPAKVSPPWHGQAAFLASFIQAQSLGAAEQSQAPLGSPGLRQRLCVWSGAGVGGECLGNMCICLLTWVPTPPPPRQGGLLFPLCLLPSGSL